MNSRLKKFLAGSALCFTLYNTLPSVFFYTKASELYPSKKDASKIFNKWNESVNEQKTNIESWLSSYSKGLNLNLLKISSLQNSEKTLILDFNSAKEASTFEKYFSQAMTNFPYKGIKLHIAGKDDSTIYLITNTFFPKSLDHFSSYITPLGKVRNDEEYKKIISSRIESIKKIAMRLDPLDLQLLSQKTSSKGAIKKDELLTILKPFKNKPAFLQKIITFAKHHNSQWAQNVVSYTFDQKDPSEDLLVTIKHSLEKTGSFVSTNEIEHPFIKTYVFDDKNDCIKIELDDEIISLKDSFLVKNLLVNLFSQINEISKENFVEHGGAYISSLLNTNAPLVLTNIKELTQNLISETYTVLKSLFKPQSLDFSLENFSIIQEQDFSKLSYLDQDNALIVTSGYNLTNLVPKSGPKDSLFIIYKNGDRLVKDFDKKPESQKDFKQLLNLISYLNFKMVPQAELYDGFKGDLVFESKHPTQSVWDLISENHKIFPEIGIAISSLRTNKERLIAENKHEIKEQEALLKWNNQYQASLNNLNGYQKFTIAKPTKNPFFSNLTLNIKHFFKGSDKKALKFGLDLSGGKNILIQLEDLKGKKVTSPEDIKLAIDELYARVNRLGVSEVSIRQEGDYISLDFPGSQNVSAKDLINASTMFFHVVNEAFSFQNPDCYPYVNEFLKQVWQQALQTGNTEAKNIQKIAFKLLNDQNSNNLAAIKLREKGLKLANPEIDFSSDDLNTHLSKVVKIKNQDLATESSTPLLIVFNNYALEGASLKDINTSYEASKGNYLSFNIHKNIIGKKHESQPQETLFKWTCQYTKNKGILNFQPSRGWRMAVLLNSEVVSSPVLESSLKDAASITGSFSQQELLKLKADLQAGSMTFQPKIVYEQNIAPELGKSDKTNGFISMGISLALVTVLMTGYYRFHGLIATAALLLNLLMLFASAAFLNITLSLASIAGIILTLGMAVDANVLIFERMREEKAKGAPIKDSVIKGYSKAFSAILDSNLTTMIAAFVLLGFDSGPIKGFALTLLVGLITSVITALFMTKMFYLNWVEKTKSINIRFSNWFKFENLNFFRHTKTMIMATLLIFVAGGFSFATNLNQIIGMDFKGGYAFNLKIDQNLSSLKLKNEVKSLFIKGGLKETHIHIRELDTPHHLRVFLDKNGTQLKQENESWHECLSRLSKNSNIKIDKECLLNLDTTISTISGQLSASMTSQAIIGLLIALCAIFIYVLIRFEWAYAISATISLCHDVILTIASMGILSYLNVPINLDMSSLAAILTIIGYSLNDTIIVFDRIREEANTGNYREFKHLVLKSLNTTLSRTVMTSATTLIVLLPMLFLGQGTLFNFSLVMTIGVIMGTFSTLFIACPLLMFFKKGKQKKEIVI